MSISEFNFDPIGYFYSPQKEKYAAPKQSGLGRDQHGKIILNPGCNYEQALDDLEGFERIWVIYCFHKNQGWKPKVFPPTGVEKRGVFATRSPHRPNPIGLSCLELLNISGRELIVAGHDLIDGTPILDIKPYVVYADAFTNIRQGWLDDVQSGKEFSIAWSDVALRQAEFINKRCWLSIKADVEIRLMANPFPFPNHRITEVSQGQYVLGYKTWRVAYEVDEHQFKVYVKYIFSGYDEDTLAGIKSSRWDDVPVHRAFLESVKDEG